MQLCVYIVLEISLLCRNLVKNLVVGYVQAPDRKKPEVLNLIAKILDFSPSEVEQVHVYTCTCGGVPDRFCVFPAEES